MGVVVLLETEFGSLWLKLFSCLLPSGCTEIGSQLLVSLMLETWPVEASVAVLERKMVLSASN